MLKFLKRTSYLAVRLPLAVAWDCLTFCTFGERSETEKALQDHRDQCLVDDVIEVIEKIKEKQ